MIVYVDVIFLENFILDLIVLFATKIICNSKTKKRRIVAGGAIGGIYSVIVLVLNIQKMILNIAISFVIVLTCFGYKNKRNFAKHYISFYLTAIVFSGASSVFANRENLIIVLICGVGLGFGLIVFAQKILKKKPERTCDIEISYKGKLLKTKALIDSGNLLKEKTTNLPVIIVEENRLSDFEIDIDKTKIIPFSSLGNTNGILIGFLPDGVKIYTCDDSFEKKAFIGIYEGKLNEGKNEYNAIIGSISEF